MVGAVADESSEPGAAECSPEHFAAPVYGLWCVGLVEFAYYEVYARGCEPGELYLFDNTGDDAVLSAEATLGAGP